jgi:hypothetical protein
MTTAPRRASRTFGPGRGPTVAVAVGLAITAAVFVAVVSTRSPGRPRRISLTAVSRARAPAASTSSAGYGQIPSWLPKPKVRVGRTAVATAAHPWLAIEGDTVSVRLARGRVLATAVGPAVPETGRFPVPASTPCTFTLTFTAGSVAVPLNASAFTIIDEYGHVHHPRVTVAGGGSPPTDVAPRRTVSLTATDVLPTGNGRLSWSPVAGAPIVSWDFAVEID